MRFLKRAATIATVMCAVALLTLAPSQLYATTGNPVSTADDHDIVHVATEAGFETLVTAVKAAGLVETLKSEGPFTVFAPTDEAFAKLPEGTLESLLLPENKEKLIAILTYHVVPGNVTSDQVVRLEAAETVEGSSLAISVQDGAVMINGAQVLKADVEASNGVVHVIDTVLLPPTDS